MSLKPISFFVKLALTCAALWILVHHETWACTYPPSDPLARQKKDCDARPDRAWNCKLARCLPTKETLETEKGLGQCEGIEDVEQANRCRLQQAKDLAKGQKGVDADQNRLKTDARLAAGVQSAIGGYYVFASFVQGSGKCKALSAQLLAAGGGASVVGSLFAYHSQRKGSKKLSDRYEKLVAQTGSSSAQVEAFDFLIEEQKLVEKAAGRFAKANQLASGLFAAGAAAAAYDMLRGGVDQVVKCKEGCNGQGSTDAQPSGFLSLISKAKTLGSKALCSHLNTPHGRVILGSTGAGVSLYVASLYAKEGKLAKERREKLTELREALAKRLGVVDCPTREDPRSPECFCFLKENVLNPERRLSKACQKHFGAGGSDGNALDPNTYSRSSEEGGSGTARGCLSGQGQFDPDCHCRQQRSSSGQNNCQKSSFHLGSFPFAGLSSDVDALVGAANGLNSGASRLDGLSGSSLGQGAAKMRKALNKLSGPLDKKLKAMGKRPLGNLLHSKTALRRMGRMLGSQGTALAKGFNPSLGGVGKGDGEVPSDLQKAVESFWKRSGKNSGIGSRENSPKIDVNTLFGSGKSKEKDNPLKYTDEYDYGKHDIHSAKGESLWDIIGHRYRQTAYPILFE